MDEAKQDEEAESCSSCLSWLALGHLAAELPLSAFCDDGSVAAKWKRKSWRLEKKNWRKDEEKLEAGERTTELIEETAPGKGERNGNFCCLFKSDGVEGREAEEKGEETTLLSDCEFWTSVCRESWAAVAGMWKESGLLEEKERST